MREENWFSLAVYPCLPPIPVHLYTLYTSLVMHTYTQTYVGYIWSTHGTRVVFIFTLTYLKHTHSVNHGAHSHFYILGTGRVHTETHTRHAYANLYGHIWMHIKQLNTCRACANRTHKSRAQRYTVRYAPTLRTHTFVSDTHS